MNLIYRILKVKNTISSLRQDGGEVVLVVPTQLNPRITPLGVIFTSMDFSMKYINHRIKINGDTWTYRLFTKKSFEKYHNDMSDEAYALVDKEKHQLHFVDTKFAKRVVIHELIHAYCKYLYTDSASISHKEYEEMIAEMMEEKILKIVEQSDTIFNILEKEKSSASRKKVRSGKRRNVSTPNETLKRDLESTDVRKDEVRSAQLETRTGVQPFSISDAKTSDKLE